MSQSASTRREFLTHAVAGVTLAALADDILASQQPAAATGLPTRRLGRTGQQVSIVCLGGWHIGSVKDPAEAIRIMHAALDEGVTFFDNAWDYHDGGSEDVMGRALADGKRAKCSASRFCLLSAFSFKVLKSSSSTAPTSDPSSRV